MIKAAPVAAAGCCFASRSRAAVTRQPRGLRLRRGTARVDLRASVFCTVRGRVPQPLCGFYAAAFTRLLALFDIGANTEVVACRGTGGSTCVLNVSLVNGQPAEPVEAR
jgi:predicted hydrocarbon binding protein